MRPATLSAALSACAIALAGCGGSSSSEEAVPSELVGTYTSTLEQSDLPKNAAPELEAGDWETVVATSGAPDGGPALAINYLPEGEDGNLEAAGLAVEGDRFLLEDEECAAGSDGQYAFYDNEYSWKLTGSTLTLATVTNDCPDRVAETILTSHPWTKQP
jgi:hypothetical protein